MDEVKLSTFPSNRNEALAMLWLSKQDLGDKTPTQIHEMYWNALYEIRKDYRAKRAEGYFNEL